MHSTDDVSKLIQSCNVLQATLQQMFVSCPAGGQNENILEYIFFLCCIDIVEILGKKQNLLKNIF